MPKKGITYPIDDDWKRRVEDRMIELKLTRAEFGRRAKMSRAAVTEMLGPGSTRSACVPDVHRVLGWDPPVFVLAPDVLELIALYESMSERDQGEHLGGLRANVESRRKTKKPR